MRHARTSTTTALQRTKVLASLTLLTTLLAGLATVSARAEDWPRWLGPRGDGSSAETGWSKDWPAAGPPVLWRRPIGSGYSGLVIVDEKLVLFHRVDDEMRVDLLEVASGEEIWSHAYATDYVDSYGYDGGPRCSPEVVGERVVTLDPHGALRCLDLADGDLIWKRDLRAENDLEQNFFGTGASPLIADGVIYAHVGGREITRGSGYTFAVELESGDVRWKTANHGGSYASPVLAEIDGTPHLFVFHRGGLSAYDPKDGRERWYYRWHSRTFESVNAATPIVSDDLVLITATYGTGASCLRVKEDGYEVVWQDDPRVRTKRLEVHWTPPHLVDGHVYGFSGRHSNGCTLNCVELATGEVKWRWPSFMFRGSLLRADGHFLGLGEYGDLALLRLTPAGHEVVEKVESRLLRYPAWTMPLLVDGRLYLRDLHRVECRDLRSPTGDAPDAKDDDDAEDDDAEDDDAEDDDAERAASGVREAPLGVADGRR